MRLALVALVAAAALWKLGRRLRVEPVDPAPLDDVDWLAEFEQPRVTALERAIHSLGPNLHWPPCALCEPRPVYLTASEWRN